MSVAAEAAFPFSNEVLNDPSNDQANINMIFGDTAPSQAGDVTATDWTEFFESETAVAADEDDTPQAPSTQPYLDNMDEDIDPTPPPSPKPVTPVRASPKPETPPASPQFAVPAPPTKPKTTPVSSTDTTPKKRLHRRRRHHRHHKSSDSASRSSSSKKKHRKHSSSTSNGHRRKRKRSSLVDDEAEQSGTGSSDDDEQLSEGSEFESISGKHSEDDDDDEPSVSAYRALDSERSAEDVHKSDIVADHFFGDRFSEKVAFNIAQILKSQGSRDDAPSQQAYARALAGISTERLQPVTCAAFCVSMIASVLAQSSQTDVDAIIGMIDKPLKRPWEEHAGNIFRSYSSDVYTALQKRVSRYMDRHPSSPFVAFAVTTQRPGLSHASVHDDGVGKLRVFLRFKPMYASPLSAMFNKMVEKRVLGPPGANCDGVVDRTYMALLPSRVRRRESDKFLYLPAAQAVAVAPSSKAPPKRKRDEVPPKQHYERHPLTITVDPVTGQRTASDRGAFVYSIANQLRHLGSRIVLLPDDTFVTLLRQAPRCQQQSWFAHHVADNLLSDDPEKVARKLPFRWLLATLRLDEKSPSFVEARQFVKSHSDEQLEQHYDAFAHQLSEKQLDAYYSLVHVFAGFLRCGAKRFRYQLRAPRIGKRKHRDGDVSDLLTYTVLEVNEMPTERSFWLTADAERVYSLIFNKYLQHIGYEEPYTSADASVVEASTARFLKQRQLFAARIDEHFNDDPQKPGMINLNADLVDETANSFVRSIYGFVVPIFDSIFPTARI